MTFLTLVAGVAGLVLFALRRNEREYLWFAAFELFNVLGYTLQNFADFHTVPALLFLLLDRFIWVVVNVIFVEFVRSALKARRDWLYWSAIGFQAATPLFGYVAHQLGLNGLAVEVAFTVLAISGSLATWALLYRGARSGNPDALLMLVPVGAFYLSVWSGEVSWLLQQFGLTGIENYRLWVRRITDWPFPISLTDITTTAWQLALFSILLLRFARTRREEQRMASELEAARAVQHILIPEEIPAIQGFQIQCVYKPAGEVGGDFFQIVPLPAGGALLAIGDVSGKGTPAAMMVSLLVGTLRTAIESSPSPAAILGAMNRRLIGRTAGGFATCLVLRVAANGAVTAANAGHLAPFVNGKEVPVDNSLPLGLEADTTYGESMLQLGPQDQLILMTDGVIEARNSNRELFGFDRAAAMAWESASEMAARAQQFGQEDDITIVRVVRQAPGEAAITRVDSTAWSPTAA